MLAIRSRHLPNFIYEEVLDESAFFSAFITEDHKKHSVMKTFYLVNTFVKRSISTVWLAISPRHKGSTYFKQYMSCMYSDGDIGGACEANTDCKDANAECKQHTTISGVKVCQCVSGYTSIDGTCMESTYMKKF